jgi:hypothetical protein
MLINKIVGRNGALSCLANAPQVLSGRETQAEPILVHGLLRPYALAEPRGSQTLNTDRAIG